jgi:hypothetical protein
MSKWTKVHAEPGVQTQETVPLHPDSVEQIKSDDVRQMLKHANQQLELQRAYPGRQQQKVRANQRAVGAFCGPGGAKYAGAAKTAVQAPQGVWMALQ